VRYNVPVDSETRLVTDFVNLKIKLTQSFRSAHKCKMYVRMFIGVSARTYMIICVCIIFLKKKSFYWWRTLTAKKAKEDEEEHAIPISATFFSYDKSKANSVGGANCVYNLRPDSISAIFGRIQLSCFCTLAELADSELREPSVIT
jgi:hypothetical protein